MLRASNHIPFGDLTLAKATALTPFKIRGVVAANRTVVSPMVQYRATDGLVNDYHMVHLGKFALGKFGIVFTENCAVVPEGRVPRATSACGTMARSRVTGA